MKKTIRTVIMCMCILAGAWLVSSPSYAQENHTYQTQIEPRMGRWPWLRTDMDTVIY